VAFATLQLLPLLLQSLMLLLEVVSLQKRAFVGRPDTYVGSLNPVTEVMWVLDSKSGKMVNRKVTYAPGLYKIFDEILVNAADNKQRDGNMDTIKVDICPEKNEISVWNNGMGIPIEYHKVQLMPIGFPSPLINR
jgi:DNA gyrase/topoisomerase IV subunit B